MGKSFKNWTFLAGSDFITQIAGFIITIKLTQELTSTDYGVYNVVLALSSIFAIFANCGMSQVIIRTVARNPESTESILSKVKFVRIGAIITTLVFSLLYQVLLKETDTLKIVSATVLMLSLTSWDFVESVAFGKKNTRISSMVNMFTTAIWILIVFFLPNSYFTIFNILIIYCSITFVKSVLQFSLAFNNGIFKNGVEQNPLSPSSTSSGISLDIIKESLPYLWLWGVGVFANQIPIILLEARSGLEQVAYYSVGAKLVLPLMMVVSTVLKAVFPTLSELSHHNKPRFNNLILLIFSYIILAGSLLAFCASIVSPYLIPTVFGSEYINSIDSFNYLIWFGVMYSIDLLIGSALSASDKQNMLAKLATIDIIIGFPLLYIGSAYGANGLALAKLIHIIISMSYHWFIVYRLIGVSFNIKEVVLIYGFLVLSFLISNLLSIVLVYKVTLYFAFLIGYYFLSNSPLKSALGNAKNLLMENLLKTSSK